MICELREDKDLFELGKVLTSFYDSLPYRKKSDDVVPSWVDRWKNLINMDIGLILGLKLSEEIVGGIGLIFAPALDGGASACTEAFWYVDEKNRGGGIKLLKKAEAYAKARGCARMMMIHLKHSMPEKLKSLYERMGYSEVETNYMKEF